MGRTRRVEGAIYEVAINGRGFSYAQALSDPLVGFYDGWFSEAQSVETIAGRPFKFRVWVHRDAFKRWRRIGDAPVLPQANDQWFYIQDAQTKSVELYQHGTGQRRAVDACLGDFESAAVWEPEHVEERLADEGSGQINRHVAAMLERAQSGLIRRQ